ncbi:MAG: Serine/threonine phosphatase PPP [uncultured Nocardioidaceae bacterium]|uniref:Serine/threonine phosphatase PPP n=1 Tax=uncultured Nocardioidaceae bacterium TaxID=253824 RepID=A0A6J4MBF1_9ACTN|nr:MAG: Serine/threonine phosphatase PPP [uncultured Nocardioidaceae bacterium]
MTQPATRPPDTPGGYRLRYTAVTDVGRHRKENQDSGYASERLLVVADGVGGAAYGDVASATAVELIRRLDPGDSVGQGSGGPSGDETLTALAGAVHRVHDRLAELVEGDAELDGTSTTVTATLFDGHGFGFVHVGDSRAYHWRRGQLQQLTKDHTFVQTLVDEGRISEAESRVHPQRNIILRAVDGVHETEPDLFRVDAEPGDRVLLCSDGCSGAVEDQQIAALLGDGSVDSAAVALVHAALDGGTTDNVTVVVAEVVAAGAVDDEETSAAAAVGPMLVGAAAEQPRRGPGGRAGAPVVTPVGTPAPGTPEPLSPTDTGDLEPVPDEHGGAGESLDEEHLRYAPLEPKRHPLLRRLAFVLVPLLLVAAVAWAGWSWTQGQYYVAQDGDGVSIFRGVQVDVPGLRLSEVHEKGGFALRDLGQFSREQVEDGIVADDLGDAERILDELSTEAADRTAEESSA